MYGLTECIKKKTNKQTSRFHYCMGRQSNTPMVCISFYWRSGAFSPSVYYSCQQSTVNNK